MKLLHAFFTTVFKLKLLLVAIILVSSFAFLIVTAHRPVQKDTLLRQVNPATLSYPAPTDTQSDSHVLSPQALKNSVAPSYGVITSANMPSDLNLLANSSFEAGNFGGAPKSWGYFGAATAVNTQVSPQSVRTGSLALKFEDQGAQALQPESLGISQPQTSTINGRAYVLTVFLRSFNLQGHPSLRLGLMGGAQPGQPNGQADVHQDFALNTANTKDWTQFSLPYTNAALGKYPYVEILNYSGGTLFADDTSFYEVHSQANSPIYQSIQKIADGSMITDSSGNFYPANDYAGSLGTLINRWSWLYGGSGNFSNDLYVGGNTTINNNATINGNLQVNGAATISGNVNYTGTTTMSNITFSNLGAGIAHLSAAGALSSSPVNLSSSDVSSILSVANGGTGDSSLTQYGVLYGNGTSGVAALTPGTSGFVLYSNGTGAAPSWGSVGSVAVDWTNPGTIGSATPNTGKFTSLAIQGPHPFADVRAYGALGDGSTDDTAAIQAALDAVNADGGGEVYFPSGTYIATTLTIYSKIHLVGSGIDATTIKLKNASNVDLVKSSGFAGLTGTNSTGGIYNWTISDLTLDGNKANNLSAGYALRVYGYGFILQNIRVRNARNDGIYSEWSTSSNSPGNDSMEAQINGIKVHDNAGNGITWNGPHDSSFVNAQIYVNGDKGVWLKAAATGAQFTNAHAWGNTNYGWYIESGSTSLNNTEGEGSSTAQVMLGGGNDTITGGLYFAGGNSLASATGIQIGDGSHTATGFYVDTLVTGFNTGIGIAFTGDGGGGFVKADVSQTGSTGVSGTPSSSTEVNVHVNGGGTGAITNFASGNVGIGNNAPTVKLDTVGTIRAVTGGTHNIGSYVIPEGGASNSFRMGFGNNAYFDGSNWVTVGDGSNNGASMILSGYGSSNSNLVFYTMPSTGGSAQSISDSGLASFEKMRLTTAGLLGIGTTAPKSKLDIQGAVAGQALVNINETGDQNLLTASASGVTKFSLDHSGNMVVAAGNKWMPLTDSTTAMNIATANGTNFVSFDSVSTRFVVTGASGQLLKLNTATNLSSDISTILYNNRIAIGYDGTISGGAISISDSGNSKPTVFTNGGTERARILSNGAVGIGTSAPLAQLHVKGNFAGNAAVIIDDLNSTDILAASASGTSVFRIDNSGSLMMATGAKIQPLSDSATAINIANAAGTNFVSFDSASTRITVNSAGGQTMRLATTGNTSSDTSTILLNARAIIGYDGTVQGVLINDNSTSKPIVFQTGNPDVERMRITNTGAVQVASLNTAGGVVYNDASGTLLNNGAGTSGFCLTSGGSGAPTWQTCAAGASSTLWTSSNGSIYPLNSTEDFFIGGQSTAAAKFAVVNVNSGTPVASVSAGNNGAAYLTADGKLATTARQSLTLGDGSTGSVIFNQGGAIGIGTTAPTAKVEISGAGGNYVKMTTTTALSTDTIYQSFNSRSTFGYDGTVQGVLISDEATSKPIVFETGSSTNERMRITSTGLVGIGTTTPAAPLQVTGAFANNAAVIINQNNSGNILAASVSGATKFIIDNNGNVGIGDTGPSNTLKVVGSLCVKSATGACAGSVSGTIYASNTVVQTADLAENYISALPLQPGDVVVPGQDGNNMSMSKSSSAYQQNVIGVISTQPGVTLNSDAVRDASHPYIYPIGLSGRVPVKVSTENGPINVGDYLTTSSQPGIAMRATQSGPVLGKALEAYSDPNSSNVGKVMTFVGISWYTPGVAGATSNSTAQTQPTLFSADQQSLFGTATQSGIIQYQPNQNRVTVSLNMNVFKDLQVSGGVIIGQQAEFRGPAIFKALVEFFDKVIFHNTVTFEDTVTFDSDSAGYAVIHTGSSTVDVKFVKPYANIPVITATLKTLTKLDAYRVTNESPQGFTIEIQPASSQDVEFSWTAIAVTQINTTISNATPTPSPTTAPSPSTTPTSSAPPVSSASATTPTPLPTSTPVASSSATPLPTVAPTSTPVASASATSP